MDGVLQHRGAPRPAMMVKPAVLSGAGDQVDLPIAIARHAFVVPPAHNKALTGHFQRLSHLFLAEADDHCIGVDESASRRQALNHSGMMDAHAHIAQDLERSVMDGLDVLG